MHCGAGLRTTVTLILPHFKWLPDLSWGENCSKIVRKFHRYKYCTAKWVTHFVEQTCSTDYYRVFRCAEDGQISGFDPLPRKICCRSDRKKAPILKILSSWRRYVQITGLNLLHETKFQRFLSGKSVLLNSKFQIREFFHIECSEEKFLKGSVGRQIKLCFWNKRQMTGLLLMQLASYRYVLTREITYQLYVSIDYVLANFFGIVFWYFNTLSCILL